MYDVKVSDKAEKQLGKLPESISDRILATLERIRIRPYAHAKRLQGTAYFRFRCGEYRIIADIQDKQLIILVIELGHRKAIYK
ncbi:TPA: type II toxin-antitoxin system RelE/ParE family toxin [Candidatus Woesearchaeota archaeon]|nr:type II toxin-antitoxin system RelE/ParE family toxin [Candidatus Woesearchaeota archaeon]